MPARKKKSIPQRRMQQRAPLTPMRTPLTLTEVQRLQTHLRKHGPHSLTPRQHAAVWDFLFERPAGQRWLSEMVQHTRAAQAGQRPSAKNTKKGA